MCLSVGRSVCLSAINDTMGLNSMTVLTRRNNQGRRRYHLVLIYSKIAKDDKNRALALLLTKYKSK